MSTHAERAELRRLTWTAEVVPAGTPDGPLYAALTPSERLRALAALNLRVWTASGRPLPEPLPRSQWPSEVFEIGR